MKCFVTGASGFIGSNLVHELNARGYHVKALLRPNAALRALEGVPFERVTGDLNDRETLQVASHRGFSERRAARLPGHRIELGPRA